MSRVERALVCNRIGVEAHCDGDEITRKLMFGLFGGRVNLSLCLVLDVKYEEAAVCGSKRLIYAIS